VARADSTAVAQLNTDPLDAEVDTIVVDTRGRALYYTTYGPPAALVKVDLLTLARVAALVLDGADGRPVSTIFDDLHRHIYTATASSPPSVIKFGLDPFQRLGSFRLAADEAGEAMLALDASATFLLACSTAAVAPDRGPRVIQIDLATFTRGRRLELPPGLAPLMDVTIDSRRGFAYVTQFATNGLLARIRLSDLSLAGTLALNGTGAGLTLLQLDEAAGLLYTVALDGVLAVEGAPGTLHEVRLSDFTRARSLDLADSCRSPANGLLDLAGRHIYIACQTMPSSVVRIDLSSLSVSGAAPLSTGENMAGAVALDTYAGHLWVGTLINPGQLIRVRLADFQRSTVVQQYPSQTIGVLSIALLDSDGGALYVVGGTVPHTLVRLRLPRLTLERQVILSDGEVSVYCGLMDVPAGYAYLPTASGVLRVRLADMARDGRLALDLPPSGPAGLPTDVYAATFGRDAGTAYFLGFSRPGVLVQVDTRAFATVVTALLPDGCDLPTAAIFDGQTDSVYVSLYTSPNGAVLRIAAADLSIVGVLRVQDPYISLLVPLQPDYAAAVSYQFPVGVTRFRLSAMAVVGSAVLNVDFGYTSTAIYDPVADRLVIGTQENPGAVGMLNATDLRLHSQLTIENGNSRSLVQDSASGDMYLTQSEPPPALVVFPRSGLRNASLVVIQSFQGASSMRVALRYGGFLFYAGGDRFSLVTRVRLSDLSYAGSLLLSAAVQTDCGVLYGRYAFYATVSSPPHIYQVDLKLFRLADTIPVPEIQGANYMRCIVMHEPTQMLYIGSTDFTAMVTQVTARDGHGLAVGQSVNLPAGTSAPFAAVISGDYAYFATFSLPAQVLQFAVQTPTQDPVFTAWAPVTEAGETGGAVAIALRAATQTLYIGIESSPGLVVVWDIGSFSRTGHFRLGAGNFGVSNMHFCAAERWLFVAASSWPASAAAFDPVSLQAGVSYSAAGSTLPMRGGYCDPETGLLYYVTFGSIGRVTAFNATTLEPQRSLDLVPGGGEGWLRAGVLLPSNASADGESYAIYGTYLTPGRVLKVRLRDMARVDTLLLATAEFRLCAAVLDAAGRFAYFTLEGLMVVKVQVDPHPMQRIENLQLPMAETGLRAAVFHAGLRSVFVATGTQPSAVVTVTADPFMRASSVPMPSGHNEAACMVLDGTQRHALLGFATAPGRVLRLDLMVFSSTFNALPVGLEYLRCAAVDASRGVAYFGAGTTPGRIAVVQADTLVLLATLTLRPGEVSVRALVADVAGDYLYAITDTAPGFVVQFSLADWTRLTSIALPATTGRPSSMLLDAGNRWLVVATDTVPSQIMRLDAAPAMTVVAAIQPLAEGAAEYLTPSGALCGSVPLGVGRCVFASPLLRLGGSFFGGFVAPERGRVALALQAAWVRLAGADAWSPQSTASLPQPACTSLSCDTGASCSCLVSPAPSGRDLRNASLTAELLSVTVVVGGSPAVPLPVVIIAGAPALLHCRPAIISQHSAVLTIDAALDTSFDAATDALLLVSGEQHLACSDVHPSSADGQTLSCTPPSLAQRFLGLRFDVHYQRAGVSLAVLPSAVQYAWPVLAAVDPSVDLPSVVPAGGSPTTLVLQSPALAAVPVSAALTAWVGAAPCTSLAIVSAGSGALRCQAPVGVGSGIAITVVVAGAFNVTSFEAVPAGQPMSQYDGQFSFAPAAPRMGLRTTVSFVPPVVVSVQPAAVVLSADAGNTDTFTVTLALAAPIPDSGILAQLRLGSGAGAWAVPCNPPAPAASELLCEISAGAFRGALDLSAGTIAGSAALQLQARFQTAGWPDATAATSSAPRPLLVTGRPLLTSIQPISGREGTRLTLAGDGLTAPGALPAISVGGSACIDVVVLSDSSLSCTVPPFNVSAQRANPEAAVTVSTAGGTSQPLLFTYSNQLHLTWAMESANSSQVSQLPGVAPLRPLPAITVELGSAVECWLTLAAVSPAGAPVTLVAGGPLALAEVNSSAVNGRLISFPTAALVAVQLVAFTAELSASCRDAHGLVATTEVTRSWAVGAFSVEWSAATAARAAQLVAPVAQPDMLVSMLVCWPAGASDAIAGLPLQTQLTCEVSAWEGLTRLTRLDAVASHSAPSAPGSMCSELNTLGGLDLSSAPFGGTLRFAAAAPGSQPKLSYRCNLSRCTLCLWL